MVGRIGAALLAVALVAASHTFSETPVSGAEPRDVDLDRDRKADRLGNRLPAGAVARLGTRAAPAGHGSGSKGLAFSPDGSLLAFIAHDGDTYIWDVKAEKELHRFAHDPVHFPRTGLDRRVFTTDGKLLVGDGGAVWDVATGKTADGFGPVPKAGDTPLAYPTPTPDGKNVLFLTHPGHEVGEVVVFDLLTRKEVRRFGKGTRVSGPLVFSPDGRTLACAKAPTEFTKPLPRPGSPPLRRPHVEGDASGVLLWDPGTGEKRAEWGPGRTRYGRREPVGFSIDGKALYVLEGERVTTWDVATEKPVGEAFDRRIQEALLLPGGDTLAVVEGDGVALWAAADQKVLGRADSPLRGLAAPVLAASPSGRWLATGLRDGPVLVWDVAALRTKP